MWVAGEMLQGVAKPASVTGDAMQERGGSGQR